MENGIERLRRWTDEHRGVPPAVGRMRASFDEIALCTATMRLPLHPELLLPSGAPTSGVIAMLADFALAAAVITSLPDLRAVATISLAVDHLDAAPASGALVARCTATPYDAGRPQHARGEVRDDTGRLVAHVSGWLMPTPTEPSAAERLGLVTEPAAAHVLDLLGAPAADHFALVARDALSNAIGSLHGGIGALACSVAAEAVLPGLRPLTSTVAFLRPTPREGTVTVRGEAVRKGRRTGAATSSVVDEEGRLLVQAHLVAG